MTFRPLIGFFVAGAILFGVQRWLADASPIVPVRPTLVVAVAASAAEAEVERAIDEAVLVQTALDRGGAFVDPVVRDRLRTAARLDGPDDGLALPPALAGELAAADPVVRQRLLFQAESLLAARAGVGPTTEALLAYLAAHSGRYRRLERLTVDHVFVSPARHPDDAEAVAAARLGALVTRSPVPSDPTLLPAHLARVTASEVEGRFGAAVASAVFAAEDDRWFGPIRSPFGLHLLRAADRVFGRDATLAEVDARVRSDLAHDQRQSALTAAARALRARYVIDVRRVAP